ncbi:hypothetical protein Tco_1569040 [Tanacetum coccineum]
MNSQLRQKQRRGGPRPGKGRVAEWSKAADCKSVEVFLRRFESCLSHLFVVDFREEKRGIRQRRKANRAKLLWPFREVQLYRMLVREVGELLRSIDSPSISNPNENRSDVVVGPTHPICSMIYGSTGATHFDQLAKILTGYEITGARSSGIFMGILSIAVGSLFKITAVPFRAAVGRTAAYRWCGVVAADGGGWRQQKMVVQAAVWWRSDGGFNVEWQRGNSDGGGVVVMTVVTGRRSAGIWPDSDDGAGF